MASDVIERMQADHGLAVRQRRDRLVSDISARLVLRGAAGERETADELLASVFVEVARSLDVELYFNFGVVEGEPQTLRLVSCAGLSDDAQAGLRTIRFGEYLCGLVAQTRQPVVIEDVARCGIPSAAAVCAMGATAYAGYPLLAGERLIGTIAFATARRVRFLHEELELIQTVADLLAAAVERDRLAATLRESESRLTFALDAAGLGQWDLNLANHTAYRTLGHDQIFGYDELLPEWTYEMFLEHVLPEDRADVDQKFKEAVAGGPAWDIECRIRRADGKVRWIWTKAGIQWDARGNIHRMLGVVGDLTERKRAEEDFRTLADNMSQLAWMTDAGGSIVWYNQRWFEYTGTTLDEMRGWGWTAVHHPDHVDRVVEKIARCFETGEPWEDTFPLRGVDGEYRWFLSRARPIRDAAGTITRWFGTNTDVTALRDLEHAMREADRRKDEFLATLAHELRNPLAPIRTGLAILRVSPANGAVAGKALGMMARQLGHMVRLIDDLLDVSRVSRGKVELKRELVMLSSVVESAVETSRPLVEAGRHALALTLPDESIWLDVDPTRVSQVISNILNNSAKYTPDGGRIELVVERRGTEAILRVTDTGVGIPRDMLPDVFDLFTQVGRTLDRAQGGLGIGLSLAKKLVEMHGGSIAADSPGPGQGSTFTVRLPLASESGEASAPAGSGALSWAPRARRVLVVDDNEDGAETLVSLLAIFGHDARAAHDGPEALAVARELDPDIVFLDIGLPGMSGYEVARRFRADPLLAGKVLVALTGWGSEDDKQRSHEAGFDCHLTKPVPEDTVREVLARFSTERNRSS